MKRWAVRVSIVALLSAGAASQCGGGGFLKWFWETFGWCGGAVVNCVFFENCEGCAVPPKPPCRDGCSYGYRGIAINDGSNTCTWQRDPSSFDCGKTIYVNGRSFCDTACIETPFSSVGYDAAAQNDDASPRTVSVVPAESASLVASTDAIRIRFNETIARRSVELGGSMSSAAAPPRLETGTQHNDTVVIYPRAHWPTGAQSLQVSVRDEAGNTSLRTVSYPGIRNLSAEAATASAAAELLRVGIAWPPPDTTLNRIGETNTFYQTYFSNGSAIYANSNGQAVQVYGDIYGYYNLIGRHDSRLGVPTRTEYDCGLFVRCADFAGGIVSWNAFTRQITVSP